MKKTRKWLYPTDASLLGLTPKPPERRDAKRNQARYRITEEQWQIVLNNRNKLL